MCVSVCEHVRACGPLLEAEGEGKERGGRDLIFGHHGIKNTK